MIIYLHERRIQSELVTIVPVADPQLGDTAASGLPPRPKGSLAILAVPMELLSANSSQVLGAAQDDASGYVYLGESLAILNYLEDPCEKGLHGFPSISSMRGGRDPLSRARHEELLHLSNDLLTCWNSVRLFGIGLGSLKDPAAARESLRWTHRGLAAIETFLTPQKRDFEELEDQEENVTIAEVVLYQFCEFAQEVYGYDVTKGGIDKEKDVYGREAVRVYPHLWKFYQAFKMRGAQDWMRGRGRLRRRR